MKDREDKRNGCLELEEPRTILFMPLSHPGSIKAKARQHAIPTPLTLPAGGRMPRANEPGWALPASRRLLQTPVKQRLHRTRLHQEEAICISISTFGRETAAALFQPTRWRVKLPSPHGESRRSAEGFSCPVISIVDRPC